MRLHLFVATAVLIAGALAAHADTVGPGTYSGVQVDSVSKNVPNTGGAVSYTDSVYRDLSNPFCSGCLDFVLQVDDSGYFYTANNASTKDFSGYLTSYAYQSGGGVAPTSVSENNSGKVTFDFGNLLLNDNSDALIVYTNALDDSYNASGIAIGHAQTEADPAGYQPSGDPYTPPTVTPEPSSLVLLGTGLLGVAGVLRRRLA